MILLVGCK